MTDIRKGGRGKQAPYQTQMVRTPVPLLELAHQLTEGYRQVIGTDREQSYLDKVQRAIAEGYYPTQGESVDKDALIAQLRQYLSDEMKEHLALKVRSFELAGEIEELKGRLEALQKVVTTYQQNSKPTRNWIEAHRLITALKQLF